MSNRISVEPSRRWPNLERKTILVLLLLGLSLLVILFASLMGARFSANSTPGLILVGLYLAGAALLLKPENTWLRYGAAGLVVASLVVPVLLGPPLAAGDWPEYYKTEVAFMNHGTPDVRASDSEAYIPEATAHGLGAAPGVGFYPAKNGREYSYHFWLVSLAAAPLGLALRFMGISWLNAFGILNAILFAVAMYGLVFWSGFGDIRSRVFASFWLVSPVAWYIGWPGAEVWSASFVALAIVVFTRRRFVLAVVLAGIAAAQNPPILALVVLLSAVGAMQRARQGRWPQAVAPLGAGLVAILPSVFYYLMFGSANLIARNGEAAAHFVTLQKLLSLYFDLNQGIFMYSPVLVMLTLTACALAAYRRAWAGLLICGIAFAMTVLASTTSNWNSGCVGIMRYAVWQLPVLVWGVLTVLRPAVPTERRMIISLAAGQMVMALIVLAWPGYLPASFLDFGPAARVALERSPRLYVPVPDTFADRTLHLELNDSQANPSGEISQLIAYVDYLGIARKVLIPEGLVAEASRGAGIDEDILREHIYPAGAPGLYYLDNPASLYR